MCKSSVVLEIAIGLCLFLDWESPMFYQQCSVIILEIAIGLCLFLDWESPLFYQQCNVHGFEDSKLIQHHVTTAQVQSSVKGCCSCSMSVTQ